MARAGVLDGKNATTNKFSWNEMVASGPTVNWVRVAPCHLDLLFTYDHCFCRSPKRAGSLTETSGLALVLRRGWIWSMNLSLWRCRTKRLRTELPISSSTLCSAMRPLTHSLRFGALRMHHRKGFKLPIVWSQIFWLLRNNLHGRRGV